MRRISITVIPFYGIYFVILGKSAYAIDESVKAIQNELYVHGPLEVAFEVYEDFLNYKGGVYIVRSV